MDITAMSEAQFIFLMLVIFQFKQLFGDYIFQSAWMVNGKTKTGVDFVFPLTVHVLIHALTTLAIVLIVNRDLWLLAFVDFTVHFAMDRIKSSPIMMGRFTDMTKQSYWIPFGLDQMVHHLTHYFIIWQLLNYR
ncbi:DUF3307 domain-containing protein [Hyphococcus sp.]|uniref:DUF3307 domain-containing protein n=1 Tax=Hyphococcus sp. TaxID=2038636 RepID=UPI003CCBC602